MDLFYFSEENKRELTDDHVFYSHLQKRDNMISELYGLSEIKGDRSIIFKDFRYS